MLRTVRATRYVTPLREGGSLPAIVEADDDGTYVLKFRGAGQGPKALVAELLAGEIGRALGLAVPEIVLVELDPRLGRSEPDGEVQALVQASAGLNLALDYLPGSFDYEPVAGPKPAPELAADVVWFDAFVTNVDRTPRNPNLLLWHRRIWLIDHGASLYFHHSWPTGHSGASERSVGSPATAAGPARVDGRASDPSGTDLPAADSCHATSKGAEADAESATLVAEAATRGQAAFPAIRDHVLLPYARDLAAADERLRVRLAPDLLAGIVAAVPEEWLDGTAGRAAAQRAAYLAFLCSRLDSTEIFVAEAARARAQLV